MSANTNGIAPKVELQNVVPWGRSFSEYQKMFALSEMDLQKNILGCSDGPAAFNVEATARVYHVTSADPIYHFSAAQIRSRIEAVYPEIMEQVIKNKDDYIWQTISNPEALGKVRITAMQKFLADYEKHQSSTRYINASLPILPFANLKFDLALCSHYLFLYSQHINQDQHILAMKELCRVAKEVRVYPLLSIENNEQSPHLMAVMNGLKSVHINVSLVPTDYEFQKGATRMLVAKTE